MLRVHGLRKYRFEDLLKLYGLDYEKLIIIIIISKGFKSECIPLFCIGGKASILYTDGKSVPVRDYENCKEGDTVGFYIKLKDEKDLFHELEHAKRYLDNKVLKSEILEEIIVDINSFFKKLRFELYSVFNFKG